MKRRDLQQKIQKIAREKGIIAQWSEGGSHSKVQLGKTLIIVPRHQEINELTAKAILKKAMEASK
jgi:UDP-N-acetylglucosamine transferase subunit ALG13